MAIAPGSRFGPYEILSPIGAGGMGEVYRARDTRLKREVALKILPDVFSQDPDRVARFQREAELLATLNHPHIAHIHGLEEAGGVKALVMELVEGETLADLIATPEGVAMPDALAIARQMAAALDAAHERGIVHRDLKPANIKVTPDGTVKVLDFGLAKALDPPGASGPHAMAHSPTITSPAKMTAIGVILGTAAYMAPEQARGKPVDKRADIWAFGCVLYELLTGRAVFEGETVTDVLGAVVRADPDWSRLPPDTPDAVRTLLRRCLQKDPAKRLRDIGDALIELDDREPPPAALAPDRARGLTLTQAVPALVLTALAAGALGWSLGRSRFDGTAPPAAVRLSLETAPVRVLRDAFEGLALTNDGRDLIFVGEQGGTRAIFRRPLGDTRTSAIPGTEGAARQPFFSPDGLSIAYFDRGALKTIARTGGSAATVCDTTSISGVWMEADTIVFVQQGDPPSGGLFQVAAGGGTPSRIDLPIRPWEVAPVPGTRAVLITTGDVRREREVHLFDLDSKRVTRLAAGASPRFMAPDILLIARDRTLFAARLDVAAGRLTTEPVALIETLSFFGVRAPLVAASASGNLAYVSGMPESESLVSITRSGAVTPLPVSAESIAFPAVSPDGRTLAVSMLTRDGEHVWLLDLARQSRVRLTTRMTSRRPVWTPDGSGITFMGGIDIYTTRIGGADVPTKLLDRTAALFPDSWSPDGRALAFSEAASSDGPRDVGVVRDGHVDLLLTSPANERGAQFSPDGRWLLFVSDESGRDEVYVQAYPGRGAKTPVSTAGGIEGAWGPRGREIYYREGDQFMAAPFDAKTGRIGTPARLFEVVWADYRPNLFRPGYTLTPDGQFLFVRSRGASGAQIQIVLNLASEIAQKLAR